MGGSCVLSSGLKSCTGLVAMWSYHAFDESWIRSLWLHWHMFTTGLL